MNRRAELLPPKEGIVYTLDDTLLENKPEERPPVQYWLFMDRIVGKTRRRFVHEITAANKKQADAEVMAIAEREDVTLIEEKSDETPLRTGKDRLPFSRRATTGARRP